MRLQAALRLANRTLDPGAPRRKVRLLCGFTPSYLEVFLKAYLAEGFPETAIDVETGLFGDLAGSIGRAASQASCETAVVVEWADLDARLGFRRSGTWGRTARDNILAEAGPACERLLDNLRKLSAASPVALCGPTLPLPPLGHTPPGQASAFELRLAKMSAEFAAAAAEIAGVRVIQNARLEVESPAAHRLDLKLDLVAGSPYTIEHADAVARLIAAVLFPAAPKKGLITDLDDTLWDGILGEQGSEGVWWDLEHHSQVHALYQQALATLAENGVLLGVASKNDPALVEEALNRRDLLVPKDALFPIEAGWGQKSESVRRILEAWNIAADSVVFVDDSAMELAEVQARFPGLECLRFPRDNPGAVWKLLADLRDRFGKPAVPGEDALRAASLRAGLQVREAMRGGDAEDFVRQLGGRLTLDFRKDPGDARALELINKTNQFNLNGRRCTEADWRCLLASPDSFVLAVSYEDKFGPLGKIAVVAGTVCGGLCSVQRWVMSCRAFSRRIECHTLAALFQHFQPAEIRLDFEATERNGPLREFLGALAPLPAGSGEVTLAAGVLRSSELILPHEVVTHE